MPYQGVEDSLAIPTKPNTVTFRTRDTYSFLLQLPGQNFYDSYTIPPLQAAEPQSSFYSAPNKSASYRPYGAPYDAVRPVRAGVYYPSSYHGEERVHPTIPYSEHPIYGYEDG